MKTLTYYNPVSWFNTFYSFPVIEPVYVNNTETVISNSGNNTTIELSLPEYKRKDLKISIENNIITIKGEYNNSRSGFLQKTNYIHNSSFIKKIPVDKSIDIENINAKFKKGILRIEIPNNNKDTNPGKIEVKGRNSNSDAILIKDKEEKGNRFFNKIKSLFK